jgi:hypothetical protein
VEIHGFCGVEQLRNTLTDPESTAIMVDIEGGERGLLDPLLIPKLSHATMIVEVHECFVKGVELCLKERFTSAM